MKKCALILGLALISGGAVLARCCDCCDRYDCRYYPPPPMPMIVRHGHLPLTYYPANSLSVSIGNSRGRYRANRGRYHGHHGSNFGASIHLTL